MVQALLMGLLALLNGIQGPYHWYFFREPVMAGFWVGLIYGDPVQGTIIGATINVSYMGWISAGGANASDLYWAGLLGTFVAIQGGMSMLMKFMYKKALLPFFVLGFGIAAYSGMTDLLLYALVGVCLAVILIKIGFNNDTEQEGAE